MIGHAFQQSLLMAFSFFPLCLDGVIGIVIYLYMHTAQYLRRNMHYQPFNFYLVHSACYGQNCAQVWVFCCYNDGCDQILEVRYLLHRSSMSCRVTFPSPFLSSTFRQLSISALEGEKTRLNDLYASTIIGTTSILSITPFLSRSQVSSILRATFLAPSRSVSPELTRMALVPCWVRVTVEQEDCWQLQEEGCIRNQFKLRLQLLQRTNQHIYYAIQVKDVGGRPVYV